MRLFALFPALFLVACPQDVGVVKQDVDNDSDGYTAEVDCDDARADINPEADEVCDGEDNDCDGDIDVGATDATTFFADADADTFGDPARTETACEAPTGYVANDEDCDDTLAIAFPGNPEVCDGVDNDCDGEVDDNPADLGTWSGDDDGDGYGEAADVVEACEAPEGYVADGTDCDDGLAAVHPDAAEADCTDPVDYNCDGSVGHADADADGAAACEDCDDTDAARSPAFAEVCDEADTDEDCSGAADDDDAGTEPTSMSTWYRDADRDGYSAGTGTSLVQCEEPTGYAALTGDCDDYDSTVNPGATEVCDAYDADEDCDGLTEDDDPSVDAGSWLTWYRDADGDTYGDTSRSVDQCEAPANYVADGTDCDDTDDERNPGEAEVCDAADKDEDCDGLSDDDDSDTAGLESWYADADGDGYGDAASLDRACEQPTDHVADDSDCDDPDADVNPGEVEVCDAADTDEDCDGDADDDDASVASGGKTTTYRDADGDGYGGSSSASRCDAASGYVATSTDCDDTDADTFPGAAASDSATACMTDADGDGYGDATVSGSVTAGDDCDDSTSAVSPAATESCSTPADDDCDGSTNDPGATGCTTWYYDGDNDGYGLLATTQCTCTASGNYDVSGVTSANDDCDDASSSISPAGSEVCDAADADEDCDGVADDDDASATGKTTVYADTDGDGYGSSTAGASYCDAPAGYASSSTDCDDSTSAVSPAATEICSNSIDDDCDTSTDEGCVSSAYSGDYEAEYASTGTTDADAMIYGEATNDYFGGQLLSGLDLDGDGYDNFVVGAEGNMYSSSYYGSFYVYDGFPSGTAVATTNDVARVYGHTTSSYSLPDALWELEDFDGDGKDELAVMHNTASESVLIYEGEDVSGTFSYSSSTYLYDSLSATGPVSGLGDENTTSGNNEIGVADWDASSDQGAIYIYGYGSSGLSSLYTINGEDSYDYAGHGLGGHEGNDPNGDGYDDIFVGAFGDDTSGSSAGAAYVVEAPVTATFDLSGAQVKITGASANDYFGYHVQAPGDFDGDGQEDMLVTAPYDDDGGTDAGVVFVFEDVNTDGASKDNDSTDYEIKVVGHNASDYLGITAPAVGDVDGDGELDLLVGANGWDNGTASAAGAAWLIYGPLAGSYDLGSSSDYDARFLGNAASDYCGASVALGDLDADGAAEILMGCTLGDKEGYVDYGTVYIFAGG